MNRNMIETEDATITSQLPSPILVIDECGRLANGQLFERKNGMNKNIPLPVLSYVLCKLPSIKNV